MRRLSGLFAAVAVFGLVGCTSTSMQGYADRELPANTVQHIAAYVAAPLPLATSMQTSIQSEAGKHGALAEDAFNILPPTRQYSDAEVRKALTERGVDGVLVITVADSGVISQYAGTIFQSSYSGVVTANGTATQTGNMSTVALNGNVNGTTTGVTTPLYRVSRKTQFSARLTDPKSGRTLWVGNGEVDTRGGTGLISRLMVSDTVSSSNSIRAIFDDLQKKGLVGGTS
jgi:hypothetical protein